MSDAETRLDELEARVRALEQEQQNGSTDLDAEVEVTDYTLKVNGAFVQPTLQQVVRDEISHYERAYGTETPIDYVVEEVAAQEAADRSDVADIIDELLRDGSIYEPTDGYVRVV